MEKQIKLFLDFLQNEKKLSDNTLQSYKRDIIQYKDYVEESKINYLKATKEDITTYLGYLKQIGKKPSTISRNLASIRSFYQFLIRSKKIKNDPTEEVQSPKVETYDMQPEMSAPEVTEKVLEAINSKKYDAIILNYANPDMVGHTGNLDAAIKAIEEIDKDVGKVVEAIRANEGVLLITADHGNSEQMVDYTTGEPQTSHTTNPVPLILVGMETAKLKSGKLADLAPTMLDIMGLEKPAEMTGESIIIK